MLSSLLRPLTEPTPGRGHRRGDRRAAGADRQVRFGSDVGRRAHSIRATGVGECVASGDSLTYRGQPNRRFVASRTPVFSCTHVRSWLKQTWERSATGPVLTERDVACARLRSGISGEARGEARGTFGRKESVLRPCQPVRGTPLLARQQSARQFFGNYPIRVDSRFCRAHLQRDKSRRRHSHSTLWGRTELGSSFDRRSPRSASNTS